MSNILEMYKNTLQNCIVQNKQNASTFHSSKQKILKM